VFDIYKYGFNPAGTFAAGEAALLAPPRLFNWRSTRDVADRQFTGIAAQRELLSQRLGLDPTGQVSRPTDHAERGYLLFLKNGRQAVATAEWYNRRSMYLYLRDPLGMPTEEAAQKARALQVDYSALSRLEKTVMRPAALATVFREYPSSLAIARMHCLSTTGFLRISA
jgi:hypothetical protein